MASVPQKNDLGSRLARLERSVENLQRQATLTSASISEGNLTIRRGGNVIVKDGGDISVSDGGDINLLDNGFLRIGKDASIIVEGSTADVEPVLYLGSIFAGGQEVARGILVNKPDGTQVAILADDGASIMDGLGNDILASDRPTGFGVTAPRFTYAWQRADFPDSYVTTDSSSWTTLWDARVTKMNPHLDFSIGVVTGGTVGQVRLVMDGSVVWTSPTFSSSSYLNQTVDMFNRGGAPKDVVPVELQARRVSGDSTIAVRPVHVLGH